MTRKQSYGMDVKWGADEIVAFRIYNDLCREQALIAFADRSAGRTPKIIPAAELGRIARSQVSA